MMKNHPLCKLETEIITEFKNITARTDKGEQKKSFFIRMQNIVQNNALDKEHSFIYKDAFFLAWVNSKIENRPFAEMVERKTRG